MEGGRFTRPGWLVMLGAKRMEWIALIAVIAVIALIALGMGTRGEDGYSAASSVAQPTEQEKRVAEVLSMMDGAGRVRVLIGEGEEAGVLVVAEGAEDLKVRLELAQAVTTLLGVENARVEVLKMDKGG